MKYEQKKETFDLSKHLYKIFAALLVRTMDGNYRTLNVPKSACTNNLTLIGSALW